MFKFVQPKKNTDHSSQVRASAHQREKTDKSTKPHLKSPGSSKKKHIAGPSNGPRKPPHPNDDRSTRTKTSSYLIVHKGKRWSGRPISIDVGCLPELRAVRKIKFSAFSPQAAVHHRNSLTKKIVKARHEKENKRSRSCAKDMARHVRS
jgi:hypothetical protein